MEGYMLVGLLMMITLVLYKINKASNCKKCDTKGCNKCLE
jgi:hypothetical protein